MGVSTPGNMSANAVPAAAVPPLVSMVDRNTKCWSGAGGPGTFEATEATSLAGNAVADFPQPAKPRDLRKNNLLDFGTFGQDAIVPLPMKLIAFDSNPSEFFVADLDPELIGVPLHVDSDSVAPPRPCRSDEVHKHVQTP